MLTPRENLLRLYRRQGYETAPVDFDLCPSRHAALAEHLGREDFAEVFSFPYRYVPGLAVRGHEPETYTKYYSEGLKDGTRIDCWGVAHEPGSASSEHMTRMRHPLQSMESVAEMEAYEWPEFFVDPTWSMSDSVMDIQAGGYAATGPMVCTIWETAWYMRSMEALMMDMASEDEMAIYLLDRVTDAACKRASGFAAAGVDILHIGDDIGMQKTIMMSHDLYCAWLKPRLKRVIDSAKEINPNILVLYHSCGFIEPFINDLIETGVDILNPIQPECMDFSMIHAKYGDRLSFNGTIGTQTTMPFGTPEEVKELVRKNLDIAGEKGGLLCCPTHLIEPEVPLENILAYAETCKEYKPK